MDLIKSTSDIIKLIYSKRNGCDVITELVRLVCEYYDNRRKDNLTDSDLRFMRYIANEAGIPQYYEMLLRYQNTDVCDDEDLHLDAIPVLLQESDLYTSDNIQLHKYQKIVLDHFLKGQKNRFFLSASTSFGKTFLIYEIIRKMQYKNVCLIFPTIALLAENIQKIYSNPSYTWVKDVYKIHTLSDTAIEGDHNLFIYTPERYLSFLDKHKDFDNDFLFVDEVYKIDNEFLQDDEQRENERDVAYRISTHIGLSLTTDCLLAGPYIKIDINNNHSSIVQFLKWAKIELVDFNDLEIVGKYHYDLKLKTKLYVSDIDDTLHFKNNGKEQRVKELVHYLVSRGENVIIYCPSKTKVESYAETLLEQSVLSDVDTADFHDFYTHLCNLFKRNKGLQWIVTKALIKGVGVHHGLVPKYIQNEIINLFNRGILKVLVVTTTITEGVNTTAKNIIVLSHKKGTKLLKAFDAKNIEGRAGRFIHHYTGRVFILDEKFKTIKDNEDELLKHKFFEPGIPKQSVDFPFVNPAILTEQEKDKKRWIQSIEVSNQVPDEIINSYRTIPPEDKYYLYESIKRLSQNDRANLVLFIRSYTGARLFKKSGFEVICNTIKKIAKPNSDILRLIELHKSESQYCTLTNMVAVFIDKGFIGSVDYYSLKLDINEAVRRSAQFVFNTLRYQLVKYLGLFNLCYKNVLAQERGCEAELVPGFDALLMRLEYNANTILGRKASDAGASYGVVRYYDHLAEDPLTLSYDLLDDFEKRNADNIREIVIG